MCSAWLPIINNTLEPSYNFLHVCSAVVKGIEWAVNQHKSGRSRRSVAKYNRQMKLKLIM
jgi:hypothetical protein